MEKIKVGIVGLGRLGRKHAENIAFRIPNAELKAVCSIIEEEIEDVQNRWGIESCYTNFYEMLKNKELNAIFIASSSIEHCKQIEAALDEGFNVFSEKPLGTSMEECYRVEKAVERNPDKIFMLGFMRRYDKSYLYAKKKVDEGVIGEPFMIRCYGMDPEDQFRDPSLMQQKVVEFSLTFLFMTLILPDGIWVLNRIPYSLLEDVMYIKSFPGMEMLTMQLPS